MTNVCASQIGNGASSVATQHPKTLSSVNHSCRTIKHLASCAPNGTNEMILIASVVYFLSSMVLKCNPTLPLTLILLSGLSCHINRRFSRTTKSPVLLPDNPQSEIAKHRIVKKVKPIKLVPYDPKWPAQFEEEANEIKRIIGEDCLDVHHIGSTSIPGIYAKNRIDILCIAKNLLGTLALQYQGYKFIGEQNIPMRYVFTKTKGELKINVHATELDNHFVRINLCFRDYMKAHREECKAYQDLKLQLSKDPENAVKVSGSISRYTLGKHEFIEEILRKADFKGTHVNFCLHDEEWKQYMRIFKEHTGHDRVPKSENCRHMILYHNTKIVGAATIEIKDLEKAVVRFIGFDDNIENENLFRLYMMNFLKNWLHTHNRSLVQNES